MINAGNAYNVIPDTVALGGTLRFFTHEVRDLAQSRMEAICAGLAQAYEVEIDLDMRNIFDVLVNSAEHADALMAAAADVVGESAIDGDQRPVMGSEDFADMLQQVPGAYGWLGHAGTLPLHNPGFTLDEGILPVGASIYARVIERQLSG